MFKQKKTKIPKNPSIRDIAKLCNVSPGTVSRVISGKANEQNPTTIMVRETVRKHNYARKRIVNKPGYLVCVEKIDDRKDPDHFQTIERALEKATKQAGLNLLRIYSNEAAEIEKIKERFKVAGVVGLSEELSDTCGLPAVSFNTYSEDYHTSTVDCDDVNGLVQAFSYLRKLGHERIAYFVDCSIEEGIQHPRRSGIERIYQLAEVKYDRKLIWNEKIINKNYQVSVKNAVDYFVSMKKPPTAIVLCADMYAPAFYENLKKKGLKIPEDINVIGFDDYVLSETLDPTLTTIRKPYKTMAEYALKLIMDPLPGPVKLMARPELIIRDSTYPI